MPGDPGNAEGRAVEKTAIAAWAQEHPVGDARVRSLLVACTVHFKRAYRLLGARSIPSAPSGSLHGRCRAWQPGLSFLDSPLCHAEADMCAEPQAQLMKDGCSQSGCLQFPAVDLLVVLARSNCALGTSKIFGVGRS